MLHLYPFSSSSKGNATLLMQNGRGLLIDCGVPLAQIRRALKQMGMDLDALDGILLTHEHKDHILAIPQLTRKSPAAVYATGGTLQALAIPGVDHQGAPFSAGAFHVVPIETSHDAAGPCGYRIEAEGKALAIVTDTGKATPSMLQLLSGCSLIMLESNYDPEMLDCGPYPPLLKRRIRSDCGHLSNQDCAALLALKALEGDLKTAVLAHLSDHNNTPLTAKMAVLNTFEQYGVTDIRLEVGGAFCPVLEV